MTPLTLHTHLILYILHVRYIVSNILTFAVRYWIGFIEVPVGLNSISRLVGAVPIPCWCPGSIFPLEKNDKLKIVNEGFQNMPLLLV